MSTIYCLGEVLVDILCDHAKADPKAAAFPLRAFAGGAPANVAVALSRFGVVSHLCGPISRDPLGEFLRLCLREAGVKLDHARAVDAPSAIAWILLDSKGERSFVFARERSADLDLGDEDVDALDFQTDDILHFSSNTLTHPQPAHATKRALERAHAAGVLVSFDLNLRPGLWKDKTPDRPAICSVLPFVHLLKVEREEWQWLCNEESESAVLERLWASGCLVVSITAGAGVIETHTRDFRLQRKPPSVEALDTTGAGDAFCGAFLAELVLRGVVPGLRRSGGERGLLAEVLHVAIAAGALSVQKSGAFASLPSRDEANLLAAANEWN